MTHNILFGSIDVNLCFLVSLGAEKHEHFTRVKGYHKPIQSAQSSLMRLNVGSYSLHSSAFLHTEVWQESIYPHLEELLKLNMEFDKY